jgi:ribosomal protein S18 acetylase RimI-like enzyme
VPKLERIQTSPVKELRVAEKILLSAIAPSGEAVRAVFPITLRPVGGSDTPILKRIFAESHCAGFELLGLEPAALAGLVGMQFQARQAQYRLYPGAAEFLICQGTGPDAEVLGGCWLGDTDEQLRVLDIAVLAAHRRRGVARAVLTALCARAAAAGKPVRLSVWHDNGAARDLYRTLGFVAEGPPDETAGGYLELRYPADRAADGASATAPAPASVR